MNPFACLYQTQGQRVNSQHITHKYLKGFTSCKRHPKFDFPSHCESVATRIISSTSHNQQVLVTQSWLHCHSITTIWRRYTQLSWEKLQNTTAQIKKTQNQKLLVQQKLWLPSENTKTWMTKTFHKHLYRMKRSLNIIVKGASTD